MCSVSSGFRDFEFDLPEALLASLILALDELEASPLEVESLRQVPEQQGIYQLLLNGEVVYIGKTDSEAGLLKRLLRHAKKIQHRRQLNSEQVRFKAIRIYVFTAIDLETQLIRHYRNMGNVAWNNSGFGSNDPGRNRDKTAANPNSFDALYPIDLDHEIQLGIFGESTVERAFDDLRLHLPYHLRYGHKPVLDETKVVLPVGPTSAREVVRLTMEALPPGWQATALAGRIVIYQESDDSYPGEIIARS
jgi:hypothetical protein